MGHKRFSIMHVLRIIFALGWADFTLKYRGSVLGYLWSFLGPLVQFMVIFFVFHPIVGQQIPQYALYLFFGIIVWEHFSMTTAGCITVLHEKATIIQKVAIPRIVLPLSVGWTTLIIFGSRLVLFFGLMCFLGQIPTVESLLYLPLLFLQMTALAVGVGMVLSSWSLLYKDVLHLWSVGLQVLYWLTPIMYFSGVSVPFLKELGAIEWELLGARPLLLLSLFIRFQPLSVVLVDARRSFLSVELGGMPTITHSLAVTLVCVCIACIGACIYIRRSRYFLQEY